MNGSMESPVVFDCGNDRLVGIVHSAADRNARLGVLIVVGGPQYRVGSHRQFALMARALAAGGISVMRFDYRGLGDSNGESRTFESIEEDIQAAVEVFRATLPELRGVVLLGLCDAASAIMMDTDLSPEIVGKILINPWVRTPTSEAQAYVRHYYLRRFLQRDFWRKVLAGNVDMLQAVQELWKVLKRTLAQPIGGVARDSSSFIDRMLHGLKDFRGPVLIVLSGRDLTAREFEALRAKSTVWGRVLSSSRVSWMYLEKADHTFSDRQTLREGAQAVLCWIADTHLVRV